MQGLSPSLNEDDGLSGGFLKRTAILRRDVTPVKQHDPPFEVPVCIVQANKGILPPLELREHISQNGEITKRKRVWVGRGWGEGGGDIGGTLMLTSVDLQSRAFDGWMRAHVPL